MLDLFILEITLVYALGSERTRARLGMCIVAATVVFCLYNAALTIP